jgi:starch phosphorylase
MAQLTPRFSASRAVREYSEQHYLPAAAAYRERSANKGAAGKQVVDWQHAVDSAWGSLRFGEFRVETNADQHVFEVEIFLNDLDPNAARVELYADGINGGDPVRVEMKCAGMLPEAGRGCVHHATVPTTRPARDYTARVIPQHCGVALHLRDLRASRRSGGQSFANGNCGKRRRS